MGKRRQWDPFFCFLLLLAVVLTQKKIMKKRMWEFLGGGSVVHAEEKREAQVEALEQRESGAVVELVWTLA